MIIDVSKTGKKISDSLFEIHAYSPKHTYVSGQRPVGSIGQNHHTKVILAASDARFADDPNYSCLYLR
jgi:hypothetical protein